MAIILIEVQPNPNGPWLRHFRRLTVRYERRADIHLAFLKLGACLICFSAFGWQVLLPLLNGEARIPNGRRGWYVGMTLNPSAFWRSVWAIAWCIRARMIGQAAIVASISPLGHPGG